MEEERLVSSWPEISVLGGLVCSDVMLPGDGFVVESAVAETAVEAADEMVGDGADGLVV